MSLHYAPCGLCLKNAILQDSHLLPAAANAHLRDPSIGPNPHPVMITRKIAMVTPKQVKAPLLCSACELLFSQKGENEVLKECAHRDGRFKLRERLQATMPLGRTPDFTSYDAIPILGDRIDSYLYFAASVFWRAAARRWKMGTESLRQLSLGVDYQEQFRLYLLGQAPFPSNGCLHLHIASEASFELLELAFPSSTRAAGVHRHKFYMLGMIFVLFLGQGAPRQCGIGALNSAQPYILLRPWREDVLCEASGKMAMTATPVGVLRKRR